MKYLDDLVNDSKYNQLESNFYYPTLKLRKLSYLSILFTGLFGLSMLTFDFVQLKYLIQIRFAVSFSLFGISVLFICWILNEREAFYGKRVSLVDKLTNQINHLGNIQNITNPGSDNDNTLAGIDSDSDGICDDLENYINDLNFDDETKSSLKKMVKSYQEITLESDDEVKSIDSNYRQINFDYCLISKIGEEQARQVQKDLKIEQFNTRQRLFSYFKYKNHFAGTGIVFDPDTNGYGDYCE